MNDVAALLTALGGLITAASAGFAVIWTAVHSSRRQREDSAQRAVKRLIVAAEDGEITPEELADARKELEGG